MPKINHKKVLKFENLIEKKKLQIKQLENEIIDCTMEKYKASGFVETVETHSYRERGVRKRKQVIVGWETWMEDFVDEDTGQVVSVQRTRRCSINNIPFDKRGQLMIKHVISK